MHYFSALARVPWGASAEIKHGIVNNTPLWNQWNVQHAITKCHTGLEGTEELFSEKPVHPVWMSPGSAPETYEWTQPRVMSNDQLLTSAHNNHWELLFWSHPLIQVLCTPCISIRLGPSDLKPSAETHLLWLMEVNHTPPVTTYEQWLTPSVCYFISSVNACCYSGSTTWC